MSHSAAVFLEFVSFWEESVKLRKKRERKKKNAFNVGHYVLAAMAKGNMCILPEPKGFK